jgi:hypothetical protein
MFVEKPTGFCLSEKIDESVLAVSWDGLSEHLDFEDGLLQGAIFHSRPAPESFRDPITARRFGARFERAEQVIGLAYGWVFLAPKGGPKVTAEAFTDLCDSVSAPAAAFARILVASGGVAQLFQNQGVLAIDAFEFADGESCDDRVACLRKTALVLKGKFRRLSRAAIVVHPWRLGGMRACSRTAVVGKYRAELHELLDFAKAVRLGKTLRPSFCPEDLILSAGRGVDSAPAPADV